MSQSRVTIYNAVEAQLKPYHDKHGFYPDKVFLSPLSYSIVLREIAAEQKYASYNISEWTFGAKRIRFFPDRELELITVQEPGEFVMVGRQDDYSNYVLERTILK